MILHCLTLHAFPPLFSAICQHNSFSPSMTANLLVGGKKKTLQLIVVMMPCLHNDINTISIIGCLLPTSFNRLKVQYAYRLNVLKISGKFLPNMVTVTSLLSAVTVDIIALGQKPTVQIIFTNEHTRLFFFLLHILVFHPKRLCLLLERKILPKQIYRAKKKSTSKNFFA